MEFLGTWEEIYNPVFNSLEFGRIRNDSGTTTDLNLSNSRGLERKHVAVKSLGLKSLKVCQGVA